MRSAAQAELSGPALPCPGVCASQGMGRPCLGAFSAPQRLAANAEVSHMRLHASSVPRQLCSTVGSEPAASYAMLVVKRTHLR